MDGKEALPNHHLRLGPTAGPPISTGARRVGVGVVVAGVGIFELG